MKVLTHDGALVTLPFTLQKMGDNNFERLDGQGDSAVGIVATMSEATVRRAVSEACDREENYSTPRELMNDIRFIARSLSSVEDGTEIRLEKQGDRIKLVVPEDAQAAKAPVTVGARVAFNGRSQAVVVNARGTVESIARQKATVKLDSGDRRRLTESTGKDYTESVTAPTEILDVLEGEAS